MGNCWRCQIVVIVVVVAVAVLVCIWWQFVVDVWRKTQYKNGSWCECDYLLCCPGGGALPNKTYARFQSTVAPTICCWLDPMIIDRHMPHNRLSTPTKSVSSIILSIALPTSSSSFPASLFLIISNTAIAVTCSTPFQQQTLQQNSTQASKCKSLTHPLLLSSRNNKFWSLLNSLILISSILFIIKRFLY